MATESVLERRKRLLGENTPLFYEQPIHIVRGEGVWLYDDAGNRYLDGYNNVPCVGHCHPHVVQAITRQAETLNVHTRYLHETILDYVERLTGLHPEPLDMAVIACTGSEANEVALRMAREFTGASGIICTDSTYHGNTAAVNALTALARRQASPEVRAFPYPQTLRPVEALEGEALTDAYVAKVEAAIVELEASGHGVAALVVCPIFANEGLPTIPPGFLRRAAAAVRAAGGLLIVDEVQSGFGRTGRWWGYGNQDVVPDIVSMGKPMGNGYPLSGVIARPELVNGFRDASRYFNTFAGNPVQCAAGMAVLDVIEEEGLVSNAREMGTYIKAELAPLVARHDGLAEVRGDGLFIGIECVGADGLEPDHLSARRIVNRLKDAGVLISNAGSFGNVLKIRPPLALDRVAADFLLEALSHVLEADRVEV